ncbi:MAG: hypothetical protein HYY48_07735 [Gammaproteobacteria bacterium]|nr:hypothetical protein [Gammaproteobacteria bacterium]
METAPKRHAPAIKGREDVLKLLESRNVARVYAAVCDLQGQLRGKSVSREKFLAFLDRGFASTPILAAADFTDVIHPVVINDAATRMGEGLARIVPESGREIPWEAADRNLIFLGEMADEAAAIDPRVLYRRCEDRARALGFRPMHACEYECSLLRETHESVHAKRFRDLDLASKDANLYGIWRQSADAEFWRTFVSDMECLGIEIDACHYELAAGAIEAVMHYAEGVRAADNAAIFKAFAKAFARRKGMMLTFMARFSHATAGHSGHVHISLRDAGGAPVFFDADAEHHMSSVFRHFIAGLQEALPETALMLLPNNNSFRRFGPEAWSFDPRWCLWGIDNRTVPLRVIPGGPEDLHLEVRIPGADANPYLALACVLAAGLRGIERGSEPTDPFTGSAFQSRRKYPRRLALPQHFAEAIERFGKSRLAKEWFGPEFVRIFAETRASQEREFRDKVSEWELRRFLELA